MHKIWFVLCCYITCLCSAENKDPVLFKEIWAYVMRGEEDALQQQMPITDLIYFSLGLNDVGRISSSLQRNKIDAKVASHVRKHCAISAPYNRSLMYWCLSKDQETRKALLQDIVEVSLSFDGVHIDFESIRPEEGSDYILFLQDLRKQLPQGKVLSVAVPARVKETKDAYSYKVIGAIVDRIIIMAYDEHYRSGAPGSIASLQWCQKVCSFAKSQIAHNKVIMGIPLYGRVWQKQEIARALKYFQTLELWKKMQSLVKRKEDGTPFFEFEQTVNAVVFYEDIHSLHSKLLYYHNEKIAAVGLWRVSQEPAALWQHLKIEKQRF